MAVADFDGDGRLDLAINNNGAPPTLYVNRLEPRNWLRLRLVGTSSGRDAVGARVALKLPADGGGKTLTRWVEAGSGYAAQSAFPLHFGLGEAERVESVEITWPSGRVARIAGDQLGINRTLRVEEGAEDAAVTAARSPAVRVSPGTQAGG